MKYFKFMGGVLAVLVLGAILASCAPIQRQVDVVVAVVIEKNQQALVAAQRERRRLVMMRCHNPMLTPSAVSRAAANPNLGPAWVDQLLKDCPQFHNFIAGLAARKIQEMQQ